MHDPSRPANEQLDQVVEVVRAHTGVTGKRHIAAVRRWVDTSDPVHGPGDDGAVVEVGEEQIIACGEAIAPAFVRLDPHGAGVASVLACVNDVAAMGGVPVGFVNTVVGRSEATGEVLRGITEAAAMYEVPVVGGHLTHADQDPSLSSFALGRADRVLSMANVVPGQAVLFACFLDGRLRDDFPFFTSIDQQRHRLAADVRVLATVAAKGLANSAKDVSMAGALGSLAMLLEFRRHGATVDLDRLPVPDGADPTRWLIAFPTYAFWLTAPADQVEACIAEFEANDLSCVQVGVVTEDPRLVLHLGGEERTLLDLAAESVTGLWGDEDTAD